MSLEAKLGLAGLSAIGVAYGFARYGYGLFLPEIRQEFDLSVTALGVIASAGYLGYVVALTLVGLLVSTVGPRLPVLIGTVCACLGLSIVAFATTSELLVLGVTLAGTSSGWTWAPFSDAVDRVVPEPKRGRILSVVSTGTTFGVIVAAPAALLTDPRSWRLVWIAFSAVALLVTIANARLVPRGTHRPAGKSFLREKGFRWFARTTAVPVYFSALSFGILGGVFWSFAVELITRSRGADQATGPLFWGLIGLSGIAGVWTGDVVARIGLRRTHAAIITGLAIGVGALGIAPGAIPAIVISALSYGASFMGMAALLAIWSSKVFPEQPATGFSATVLLLGTGSVAGPALFGAFAEQYGLPQTFMLLAGIAIVTLLAWPRRLRVLPEVGAPSPVPYEPKGAFVNDGAGGRYAGIHVLADFWQVDGVDDPVFVRTVLGKAVSACGATVIDERVHRFEPSGVTILLLLSESHVSLHSWPDEGFVAVDIFTCGSVDPEPALSVIRRELRPGQVHVSRHKRGIPPPDLVRLVRGEP